MKLLQNVNKIVPHLKMKRAMGAGIIMLFLLCAFFLSASEVAFAQCNFIPGDVNNVQGATALSDVVYSICYFKGLGAEPPIQCICEPPDPMFPAGDANGNCRFNGVDVTYMIRYYKMGPDPLRGCPSCPPNLLKNDHDPLGDSDNPPVLLSDPTDPDKVWLGNLDGTTIDVVMGGTVDIPIYVETDEPATALTTSVTTDNQYLTPVGGTFLYPLTTWDECSFITPEANLPAGRTTQSILGYRYITDPNDSPFLNTGSGNPIQIATLQVTANFDPDNAGDDTYILFGAGSRLGPTAFCNELGTDEWTPLPQDLHPVTIHILPTTQSFIAGTVYNDANGNFMQDTDEAGLAGWTVTLDPGALSTTTNALGNYVFTDLSTDTYFINQVVQTNWHQTYPNALPYHEVPFTAGDQFSGKDFGNRATWISGRVFYDIDGDCIQDQDEDGIADRIVRLTPGTSSATTNIDGDFIIVDPPAGGPYTLNEDPLTGWEQTCPQGGYSIQVIEGQQIEGMNFGSRPIGPFIDLSVDVGGGRARPGSYKAYGVRYINRGSLMTDATVTLRLPDEVQFTSCYFCGCWPDCDFDNAHTLTWNLTEIAPDESENLTAYVFVPLLDLGTPLLAIADIAPLTGSDIYPSDNHVEETQLVRMSYDPNEKQVTPEGIIERTDKLIYQIDFQNTGTDTAYDVYVIDTLAQNLDISTFISGASIHPYAYALDGRVVTWTFANIMLPDSIASEPGSHGFVKFSIYPTATVPAGSFIENKAGIVFDTNDPVITNTVSNQIANHSSCDYTVGDANNSHTFTGLDIVYSVRYFKGGPAPEFTCDCPPFGTWFVAGDVNSSCSFTGLDITKMVRHFKYYDLVNPCPDCPPLAR